MTVKVAEQLLLRLEREGVLRPLAASTSGVIAVPPPSLEPPKKGRAPIHATAPTPVPHVASVGEYADDWLEAWGTEDVK